MKFSGYLLAHSLWAILMGALLVVSIVPLWMLIVPIWFSVLMESTRVKLVRRQWFEALAGPLVEVKIMIVIFGVALAAPVKVEDRLRARTMVLPKTQMTLQELNEMIEARSLTVPGLRWREIQFPQKEAAKIVRWPAKELTLSEFLDAIEKQTCLRYRFRGGCANTITILWGNDQTYLWIGTPN